MSVVALHEKHRFASAEEVDYELFAECLVGFDNFVVPFVTIQVATPHPYSLIVGARCRKFDVVSEIYESAVATAILNERPQHLCDASVEKHCGRIHKYHTVFRCV